MTQKLGANIFESLFKMAYEPFFVDGNQENPDSKNHFPTIFSAVSSANYNSLIKINEGLYNQNVQIKTPNIKIQASEPSTNAIVISSQFPSFTINLPAATDRISLQSLKFAHLCQLASNSQKATNYKKLKQSQYRHYKIGRGIIDMNILLKRGTVYMDQCRLSLNTQKDTSKLIPSIVIQKQGTLIMTRCQLKGAIGSIGILNMGGKIIIRQSNFKNSAIGIISIGNKQTSVIIKNSLFSGCLQGIVMNGPFQGSIENNVISGSDENGVNVLTGNKCKIVNNQIKQCQVGVRLQNCCPLMMKNTIVKNKKFGIQCYSIKNMQCFPLIKFNNIHENEKGGIYLNGNGNKCEIFNNELNFNNKVGIKVQKRASPHLLLNNIKSTLGTGIHLCPSSTAFIQKNVISGSLKCNLLIQGPSNIGNYIYNNTIQQSRGQGLMLLNSQKFLINNNTIRKNNNNGILSITSVVTFQQNIILSNKNNGILLIQDNDVQFTQNQIRDNKKSGLVIRNSSTGQIKKNWFVDNTIQIVIENDNKGLQNIQEDNYFGRKMTQEEIQEKKQGQKTINKINIKGNHNNNNENKKSGGKIITTRTLGRVKNFTLLTDNYVSIQNDANIDIRMPKNYSLCQIM